MTPKCSQCPSYAINPHLHGRGDDRLDLCDVCYWRNRAEKAGDIAPRAEGEAAPLWEWVRAASERAEPLWETFGQDDELRGTFCRKGPLDGVRVSVLVAGGNPCGFIVDKRGEGIDCSTPAELRAALDELATEVK